MPKYYGCPCEGCGRPLALTDDIVVCPDCGAPYHRECYESLAAASTPPPMARAMNGRSRTKTMLCAPAPAAVSAPCAPKSAAAAAVPFFRRRASARSRPPKASPAPTQTDA